MDPNQSDDSSAERIARTRRLLSVKLTPPHSAPNEVARTEVCDRIFDAGGAKVVLICAAAGFGKTTVMTQLRNRCQAAGLSTAWYTADSADNDVGRFLMGIAGAFDKLIPGISEELAAASADGSSFALQLFDRIAQRPESFLLFLDEFEALHSADVMGLLSQSVGQIPRGAQLIIGSRVVPDIGLGRLRAKGLLLEIDSGQLRFTLEESQSYLLRHRNLNLAQSDIEQLHQRTEGWPAALWLASLAWEHRDQAEDFIASFSGSHTALADYLVEDVLAHQPTEVNGFLLRSSILEYLTAPLCNAVCDREDSQELLERLSRANLFLVLVDEARGQYRFHPLFAEFLRSQLMRTLPDEVAGLHKAAAKWYLREERPMLAIDHALRSGDLALALPLLNAHAERLLADAQMRLLARWLESVPAAALTPYPYLRSTHVWVTNFTRGPHSALTMLESMPDIEALESDPGGLILPLRAMLLSLVDRTDEAYRLGRETVARLPPNAGFAHSMLHIQLATAAIAQGRFNEARGCIDEARRTCVGSREGFGFALAETLEGEIDLLRGHLQQVIVRLRDAVDPKIKDPLRRFKANATAGILLADALYETNECDAAERLLNVYVPLINAGSLPDQLITGHLLWARIRAMHGDYERAHQLIKELELRGHRLELRRVVLSARMERARLLLAQGKLESAKDELDAGTDEKVWPRIAALSLTANDVETFQIATLRYKIRSGHAERALPLLSEQLHEAESGQRPRRALKLRILTAEALKRSNQGAPSLRMIGKALQLAAPEGFIRSFADEGPMVARLVHEYWSTKGPDASHQNTPVPQSYMERLLLAVKQSECADPAAPVSVEPMIEPLTRKEIEVLRLMSEGFSNRVLAERMFVTEATTRTHLRNINVKLGVHSRVQAIAIARRKGLIP